MRRLFAAAVAASMLAAATADRATAAPTWLPVGELAPAGAADPLAATAATGAAGDVVVAWIRGGVLEARFRAPGAAFGPAQTVASGVGSAGVAMAEDGTAVLAWAQGEGVWWSAVPRAGTPGPAQQLAGVAAEDVRVAGSPRGDVLVTFAADGAAWAALRPAGGTFEAAAALAGSAPCDVRGAVGASGAAAVGWRACGAVGEAGVARRPAGEAFGPPAALAATDALELAVGADGATGAVLRVAGAVHAAVAPPGGAFATRRISDPRQAAAAPQIAAGGPAMAAAWLAGGRVHVVTLGADGSPAGGGALSDTGAGAPRIGVGGDGSIAVAWVRAGADGPWIEAAHARPGAAFVTASPVAAPGAGDLQATADGDGNLFATFAAGGTVGGAALDTAGPRLAELYLRSGGFAEETYGFGVNPVDAWSAVGPSAIDFGDGTSAAGPGATHAYAASGAYTVTITATDAVGNASSVHRPFTVAPARDRTPPVVTRLRMDARRFRTTGRPTPAVIAGAAAVRNGTRFRYTISEPGFGGITFDKVVRRRSGKLAFKPVGLLVRAHPVAGPVSVGFSGRIVAATGGITVADVRLKPGLYRATVVVADAARNRSKPKRIKFRIRR